MITTLVRRVVPLVGLAAVLGFLVRQQQLPPAFSDTWLHLRMGREFLDGWSVARPGHLGVYDTAEWVPTQWLSQELMARIDDELGLRAVAWTFGALMMVLVGLVYVTCRQVAAPLPAMAAVTMAIAAALPGLSARPQVISYLFIVVTVGAWLRTSRDGRFRYWLIALAWAWPMFHGMWIVGITISTAAALGLALQHPVSSARLMRLGAIPLASAVVAVLTPVGLDAYRVLVTVSSHAAYVAEWAPPDFTSPHASLLALMLALVVLIGLRSHPVDWLHVTLALLALAWALHSLRTTPVAALILAPVLAALMQRWVPAAGRLSRGEGAAVAGMVLIACAATALVLGSRSTPPAVPVWLDSRLDEMAAGTRVLNDWDSGAYFLYRHPDLQLAMHGYAEVFTDAELERNVTISLVGPGWDELVENLDADYAVAQAGSSMAYALEQHASWTVVESDDSFVLLSPPTPVPEPS